MIILQYLFLNRPHKILYSGKPTVSPETPSLIIPSLISNVHR